MNQGMEGRTTEAAFIKRKAVNLEGFLTRSYGAQILPRVKYIKMDAEGFDSTILKSIYHMINIR